LESDVATLHAEMAQPEFYKQSGEHIAQRQAHLKDLEAELSATYARWQELEQCAA
jgi:ATP-binding cassette subfamily F protein uup